MYPYPYQEYESSQALTQRLKDQLNHIQTWNCCGQNSRTQVESYKSSTRNIATVLVHPVWIHSIGQGRTWCFNTQLNSIASKVAAIRNWHPYISEKSSILACYLFPQKSSDWENINRIGGEEPPL